MQIGNIEKLLNWCILENHTTPHIAKGSEGAKRREHLANLYKIELEESITFGIDIQIFPAKSF